MKDASLLLLIAIGAAGCLAGEGDEVDVTRPGIVHFYGESDNVVTAPGSVGVDEPFTVTVRTYGGGCEELSSTGVTVHAGGATIVPLDRTHIPEGSACTLILARFEHTATIEFGSPGEKLLRIQGRSVDNDADVPLELTRVVQVE